MAKARSRAQARKVKDRWKAKKWFDVLAPASFDNVTIAQTLANNPDSLIDRVTQVTMQDLTNDFRKSHILLYFKIDEIEDSNAHTHFVGHSLTSDYLRRMIRRRRSKIEGVYDVTTRDGAKIRVKPFATTDKRIQNSQKRVVRESMKSTILKQAKTNTLNEFVKNIVDGKMGSDIYKNCKKLYPVKRVEIFKTELISEPTRKIKEESEKKETEEKKEKPEESKEKEDKKTKKEEKKDEETKEEPKKEETEKIEQEAKEKTEEKDKPKETKKEKPKKEETESKEKKSSSTKKKKTKKSKSKKKTSKTKKKSTKEKKDKKE